MNLTREYGLTRRALREVAELVSLTMTDLAVLMAVRDGFTTTDRIETEAHVGGSQIRRSLLELRPEYLTGGNKRGVRSPIEVTPKGEKVCAAVDAARARLAAAATNEGREVR